MVNYKVTIREITEYTVNLNSDSEEKAITEVKERYEYTGEKEYTKEIIVESVY